MSEPETTIPAQPPIEEPNLDGMIDAARAEVDAVPDAREDLAGGFKSVQELERAYRETKALVGRQGNELGELRKLVGDGDLDGAELDDGYSSLDDPGEAAEPYDFSQAEQAIAILEDEGRYEEAVAVAIQTGNAGEYDRLLDDWHDIEPRKAAAFERQMERGAEYAAAAQQQAVAGHLATAYTEAKSRHSDFAALEPTMLEVARESPELLSSLNTGNADKALDHLYAIAKSRTAREPVPHVSGGGSAWQGGGGPPKDPLIQAAARALADLDPSRHR